MLLLFFSYKYELLPGNQKPLLKTGSALGIAFGTGMGIILFSPGSNSSFLSSIKLSSQDVSRYLDYIPALTVLF